MKGLPLKELLAVIVAALTIYEFVQRSQERKTYG